MTCWVEISLCSAACWLRGAQIYTPFLASNSYQKEISIMSCSKMNLLGLQSLQTLKVGYLRYRKCFSLQFELPSLLMLEFICCEHLCPLDGLSRLPSLKHLKFKSCPRLNFVKDEPLPGTLETVSVHNNCYALSNWRPNGFEELPHASEVCTELFTLAPQA